jgi:Cu2+-exporting ATPase
VFDKTGTLTEDGARLAAVHLREGVEHTQALALGAWLAGGSRHPVSRAIVLAAQDKGHVAQPPEPGLVLTEEAGRGMRARSPDGREWRLGAAAWCGLDPAALAALGGDPQGAPHAYLCGPEGWLATFVLDEALRPDAAATITRLHAAGLQTRLLSGDQLQAAQRMAQAVGIGQVVAGASPEQKLRDVQALQARGLRVAMVGDGLNDAPVLARADTSLALGHALPLAQAQSDFVLQGGRLADVADAFLLSRATMRIVRQNLVWAAVYNAVCVPLALIGWMPPWLAGLGMAGSSLFVIGNAWRLSRRGAVATAAGKPG